LATYQWSAVTTVPSTAWPNASYIGRTEGPGYGWTYELATRNATNPALLKPRVSVTVIMVNDLANSFVGGYFLPTSTEWLNKLWGYTARYKGSVSKVLVATVLPQCNAPAHNQLRAAVNAAIRGAVGTKIDGVINFDSDPVVGLDSAACDTTYYADNYHPTEQGYGRLSSVYSAALSKAFGP
jgi:hypothetical protein